MKSVEDYRNHGLKETLVYQQLFEPTLNKNVINVSNFKPLLILLTVGQLMFAVQITHNNSFH